MGGGRGGGRGGRGWRHWYHATGLPGWARMGQFRGGVFPAGPVPPPGFVPLAGQSEVSALKDHAEDLEEALRQVRERLAALESAEQE
jgi:hypothetical protein